jgi:hypothetical protein
MIPMLLIAALAGWQLLLAAFTATSAQNAARTASRALSSQPVSKVRDIGKQAVSSYLRDGVTKVDVKGTKVTVRVKVPIVFPGLTSDDLAVERSADLPREQ